jgi:hypothetical protein
LNADRAPQLKAIVRPLPMWGNKLMNNLPIDQTKVKELIRQCKHLNIFAGSLNRYYPKTTPNPVSDLLAELIEEGVLYLKIMPEEEVRLLVESLPLGIRAYVDLRIKDELDDFKFKRIAFQYLVAVVQAEYLSFKKIVTGDLNESEVIKVYPEIRSLLDDDGLLYIDDRFRLFDGGIEYKDHILHYHQFLRRGYSSNPNFDFLGRFLRCYIQICASNSFRIAIDHHRIMPKEFYQHIVEMDAWYGPRFDRSKLDDIYAVGLTVIKRISPSPFDLFFDKLERTEFFWSYRNGIKTFEVEGISDKSLFHDPYYLNKYAHSERDVRLKRLRHFDGAVKVYLKDSYENRLSTYMPKELRSFKKVKLFRIDGEIGIDEWIELLTLFFKGNEMIIEYFDPELFESKFGDDIRKCQEAE